MPKFTRLMLKNVMHFSKWSSCSSSMNQERKAIVTATMTVPESQFNTPYTILQIEELINCVGTSKQRQTVNGHEMKIGVALGAAPVVVGCSWPVVVVVVGAVIGAASATAMSELA